MRKKREINVNKITEKPAQALNDMGKIPIKLKENKEILKTKNNFFQLYNNEAK